MKEFRKLLKHLQKDGFTQVSEGNHIKVEKLGTKVTLTRNIKNAAVSAKIITKQWETSHAK